MMSTVTRIAWTIGILTALVILLTRLPVNPDRLADFSAERLHDTLERAMTPETGPLRECSIHARGPELSRVGKRLRALGPIGPEQGVPTPCTLNLQLRGGLYRVDAETSGGMTWTVFSPRILWTSLVPALLAIALAVAFRRLLVALLIGVLSGAVFLHMDGSFSGLLTGATLGTGKILFTVLTDKFRFYIFLFTFSLIGMVNVASVSGGMKGVAEWLGRFARTSRSTQAATGLLGLAIFFDDYSNTIVVGSSMRTLSDRMKISREKLAYLVDSTAAPIAGLALVSTWIGYEVSLIGDAMRDLKLQGAPYSMFLSTIPYRYYCILTLGFVFLNIAMRREYGPMASAQQRPLQTGEVVRPGSSPLGGAFAPKVLGRPRALNAMLPVLSVIFFTWLGMTANGAGLLSPNGIHLQAWDLFDPSRMWSLQGNYITQCRDGAWVLAMAALLGSFLAIVLGKGWGKAPLKSLVLAWFSVGRILFIAFSVLILAWSIGEVNARLGTGAFLVSALAETIAPWLLPGIVFCLSAVISFATGSSWGTMAILLPAAVPLAFHLGGVPLMAVSLGAVLDGSIFGDHCSPLSDTTVMSSIAAGCDHMDHVRTQFPYALTVALVAVAFGYTVATRLNPLFSYISALLFLAVVLRLFGRRIPPLSH